MRKTLIGVFSLLNLCFASAETILTVEYLDGGEKKEQLEKLSKIVFQNGNIAFDYNSGETKDFGALSNTQKIVFSDGVITKVDEKSSATVHVYPNPTAESISIVGKKDGEFVKIYNMLGTLVLSIQESEISVSSLADGSYIVVVGNSIIKLFKK